MFKSNLIQKSNAAIDSLKKMASNLQQINEELEAEATKKALEAEKLLEEKRQLDEQKATNLRIQTKLHDFLS